MENEFQYRLLKAIADKRISASDLSRETGIDKSAVSNYINGKYIPKQDKCYLLEMLTSPEDIELEKLWPSASVSARRAALAVLRSMKEDGTI